jgi:hypothetical protein
MNMRELVINQATWSNSGVPVLTLNERRQVVDNLVASDCWQESDRAILSEMSDRSLALLHQRSLVGNCGDAHEMEVPTLDYAAFASQRLVHNLSRAPAANDDMVPTLNFRDFASPRLVQSLDRERAAIVANTDSNGEYDMVTPTINFRDPRDDTAEMDRAGEGPRAGDKNPRRIGPAQADGDVAPGGASLRPEDDELDDEVDDGDLNIDTRPRGYRQREELNIDTYPADTDEDLNPPTARWGNADSLPLISVPNRLSDMEVAQENRRRLGLL